ncbi:carbohydrate kinase [Carbonactinospora thermoautotrophica]|uniref:carbohydrate kinase family protein n=1 Tax=Carbonactinospora thermoautotrophica TaxID=1469144 RepID=UPI0023EF34F2|nr:carbohydrate kinase [Carbonactinospora thermoautotrophica]MCX9192715.1 carbohydrate kinase [Carbonactinospora thermoautotrophica]
MMTVVGESLVDLVGEAGSEVYRARPGGSPANVAVGLARLGVEVTFVTELGADPPGTLLRRHLEGAGVRLTGCLDRPSSGLAVASLDEAGVAHYTFAISWRLAGVRLDELPEVLHVGSFAATLEPGAANVAELVEQARPHATISYDPNIRPALIGSRAQQRPRVERLVARADVVKASVDDLAWLYPGEPYDQVAARWLESGPALVVVTLGERGVHARSRRSVLDLPALPVRVVDTVGAGDAFMSGLLAALRETGLLGRNRRAALAEADPEPALRTALLAAALTCERPGADPPTRAELAAARDRLPVTGTRETRLGD